MSTFGRNLCKRTPINYSSLHHGLEQEFEEDEYVKVDADIEGERELCGSFNVEDKHELQSLHESDREDGEISENEDSEQEESEVEFCIRTGNVEKLKKILRKREEDCRMLEKEVKKEQLKERQNKEMKQVLAKLSKVNRTKKDLRRSLAGSRQSSPCDSPTSSRKTTQKEDAQLVQRKKPQGTQKRTATMPSKEQRSEYSDVFNSFMHLRQGNQEYTDRVASAMEATNNIFSIRQERQGSDKLGNKVRSSGRTSTVKGKVNKVRERSNTPPTGANAIMEIIDSFVNTNKGDKEGKQVAEALLSALTGDNELEDEKKLTPGMQDSSVKDTRTKEKTLKLLDSIKKCITGEGVPGVCDLMQADGEEKSKLVSGKCTKPDELDIKLVVKYAHEKLDPKHIQNRSFDSLELNFLIVGELELISQGGLSQEERQARIEVAKTMCYHKKYLEDSHLREGYDSIMKQIEQGKLTWADNISQKLHEHLDYRANVLMRKKLEMQQDGFIKVENKKNTNKKEEAQQSKERVFYCLEFNLGTCQFEDHHEGKFGSRKVTKLHICRRCHREGEIKSHKDSDSSCPNRNS